MPDQSIKAKQRSNKFVQDRTQRQRLFDRRTAFANCVRNNSLWAKIAYAVVFILLFIMAIKL